MDDKPARLQERRRYRKIQPRMWGDEKFRQLSAPPPNAQTLWIRLLTGPETGSIPGVYQAWDAGLAKALRWSPEAFAKAFREISDLGMARADWEAGIVWIPKAIECNAPESPNVIKGWRTTWSELPDSTLKWEAYQALKAFVEGMGLAFRKAFSEAIEEPFVEGSSHPSPNQEQEQEQEQENPDMSPTQGDLKLVPSSGRAPDPGRAAEIREVFDRYRAHHPRAFPKPVPASQEWRKIKARLDEGYSVADLKLAIDGYHQSPHHLGQNDRNTKYLGLELIVRDGTHVATGIDFGQRHGDRGPAAGKVSSAGGLPEFPRTT